MPDTHVLHVVDRVSGGVPTAVRTYIQNSPPDIRHTVLTPFILGEPAEIWTGTNCGFRDLGSGHVKRIGRIRRQITVLDPSTIHAHSSFSGTYARLAARVRSGRRIVYSPHCFAFERQDLGPLLRRAFRAIERLMLSNTTLIAGCSEQEARVASLLARKSAGKVTHIPNIASISPGIAQNRSTGALKIGMSGRISPQKDPAKFIELSTLLRARIALVEMIWLGSGESVDRRTLEKSDIHVTGWLPAEELRRYLLGLQAYFHCAAWEGFPIAVLDAHAAGVPILVRNISAFADVPLQLTFEGGLEGFILATSTHESFASWSAQNNADWAGFLSSNTAVKQTQRLREVWTGTHE